MKSTKNNSLQFTKRKPYEPVKELFQIPVALYEVLSLTEDAEKEGCRTAGKMREMMESIIAVALDDPQSWLKVENLAQNGYRLAFLPQESSD